MKNFGARILAEANDLKRTPEALAREIGWEPQELLSIIEGKGDESRLWALIKDIVTTYPISFTDLWLEPDDTNEGVTVLRSEESYSSRRIFDRKARNGSFTPYYEYRDTAMSRTAPYKPEWIKELRFVDDEDPENPDVAFNNGHLLHQITFFVGEVNFYWISGKIKFCREMNTGDSCYITPFIPHSFTSRNRDRPGLIIAVTFASSVRKALGALSRLSPEMMASATGDLRDPKSAFAAKLKRYRDCESLSVSELSALIQSKGVKSERAKLVATAGIIPNDLELQALANILEVREKDLEVVSMNLNEDVTIRYKSQTTQRLYPDSNKPVCNLTPLARAKLQPGLRGFNVEFLGYDKANANAVFEHCLHEYVYNYGNQVVKLNWGIDKEISLNSGDSAYIRPGIRHGYSGASGASTVIIRVPGELNDSVFEELSAYDADGRTRAYREHKRWF